MKTISYKDTEPLQIKILEWAKKIKEKNQDVSQLIKIVEMLQDHDMLRYNVEKRMDKLRELKFRELTIKESVRFKLEQEDFVDPNLLPFSKEMRTYLKTTFKITLREVMEDFEEKYTDTLKSI